MRKHTVKTYYTEALFELMNKKNYEDISINDLVEKSGASRASFYRNYLTKDQIIDEYLESIFSQLNTRYPLTENIKEDLLHIFEEILVNKKRLQLIFKHGLFYKAEQQLYQSTLFAIKQLNVLNNKYQPYFFAGASAAIIKAWVEFDFEETPNEMVDIFLKSLIGYMKID